MLGSDGVSVRVICFDSWQRRDRILDVSAISLNQPPPRALSRVAGPLPVFADCAGVEVAVEAACSVAGTSVGSGGVAVAVGPGGRLRGNNRYDNGLYDHSSRLGGLDDFPGWGLGGSDRRRRTGGENKNEQ